MATLTDQEKFLLREIMNDKFSAGAFSGMVFNAAVGRINDLDDPYVEQIIDVALKIALQTRLRLKELSQ